MRRILVILRHEIIQPEFRVGWQLLRARQAQQPGCTNGSVQRSDIFAILPEISKSLFEQIVSWQCCIHYGYSSILKIFAARACGADVVAGASARSDLPGSEDMSSPLSS